VGREGSKFVGVMVVKNLEKFRGKKGTPGPNGGQQPKKRGKVESPGKRPGERKR